MPFCHSFDNTKIHYQVHGNKSDCTIIFLSGLSGDHTAWQKVIHSLPDSITKIAIDNRGVGQSDAPNEPYTSSMMARDVFSVLENENINQAIIAGHSLGGAIAQSMALLDEKRIKGIILASSFMKLDAVSTIALKARAELMATDIPVDLKIELNLPWLYGNTFLDNPENIIFAKNRVLKNPYPQKIIGLKNQVHACVKHNLENQVSNITCPTLILSSTEDLLVSHHHSIELKNKISHAHLEVIKDSGHMIIIEQATSVVEQVKNFYMKIRE